MKVRDIYLQIPVYGRLKVNGLYMTPAPTRQEIYLMAPLLRWSTFIQVRLRYFITLSMVPTVVLLPFIHMIIKLSSSSVLNILHLTGNTVPATVRVLLWLYRVLI